MKTCRGLLMVSVLVTALAALPGSALRAANADDSPFGGPPDRLIKQSLWVILTTDVPGFHRPPDLLTRHLAHQSDLERRGILFAAGPVQDTAGHHEYGMIIIRAASAAEARRIADSDPMHMAGARTFTLHEWSLNEGHMNLSLDFSHSGVSFN